MIKADTSQTTVEEQQRQLYRSDVPIQPQRPTRPVNIMYDRRIYRGNTYAIPVLPSYAQPDALDLQRQQQQRRKLRATLHAEASRRPRTPDPVEGRTHMEVQTELYLEELSDTVPESSIAVQTDAFIDRTPSPMYIPTKSGIDVSTQIMPGELFNFNEEVQPILQVIVGKILQQARIEIIEEQELVHLRKQQKDYLHRKAIDLAHVQRLQQAELRRNDEKQRRKLEANRLFNDKLQAATKVAAVSFTNNYLSSLVSSTFNSLHDSGFFYNSRQRDVQQLFLPWLTSQVDSRIQCLSTARAIVDELLIDAIKRKTYKPSSSTDEQVTVVSPSIENNNNNNNNEHNNDTEIELISSSTPVTITTVESNNNDNNSNKVLPIIDETAELTEEEIGGDGDNNNNNNNNVHVQENNDSDDVQTNQLDQGQFNEQPIKEGTETEENM